MATLPTALRRALTLVLVALLSLAVLASAAAAVQDAEDPAETAPAAGVEVDILPVKGLLDPPVTNAILDVIAAANERGSSLVVLQLDHAGVVSADLDALVAAIQESAVPVAVYVGPQGIAARAGGGTLLLLAAAHIRAAAPDARLGPLVPIDVGDAATVETTGPLDRLLQLWPQLAREGGDPTLADGALVVAPAEAGEQPPGVAARDLEGALDRVVPGLEPLLTELDGLTVETAAGSTTLRIRRDEVDSVRFHTLGLVRRMLHAATTPAFIYLLLTIGLAMLLFEVFQPGFGVAGLAGLVTVGIGVFGLTVLPVAWWAVALVVIGLVLFAVDTAIAGFGPVTAGAAASFGVGSWYFYDSPVVGLPAWLVVLTTLAAAVFFVVVLTSVLRAQAGPEDLALDDLVGRPGIVRSVLNPEGHVYVDEALWRARWIGEAKRAKVGTPIRVTGVEGPKLLVEDLDPQTASAAQAGSGSEEA